MIGIEKDSVEQIEEIKITVSRCIFVISLILELQLT